MKAQSRKQRLAAADPTGWTIHTKYHWSRMLAGKRLNYWPSRSKFMFEDVVIVGDVRKFIQEKEALHAAPLDHAATEA